MGQRPGGTGILAPILLGLGACTTYGSIHPFVEGGSIETPPGLLGSWRSVASPDSSAGGETAWCFDLAEADSIHRLRVWDCIRGGSDEFHVTLGRIGEELVADLQPRLGDDLRDGHAILGLHSLYRFRLADSVLVITDLCADSLEALVERDGRYGQLLGDTPGPDVLLTAPTAVLRELLASATAGPAYFTGPELTFIRVARAADP